MNPEHNITGIILAGGKSSRMGIDKGLLKLKGKSFVQHIIEALEPLADTIIIVSSNPEYDVFKAKRIEDIIKQAGPVAGLHSGLTHSDTENNLVISCDAPLVTSPLLRQLLQHKNEDYDVVQFEAEGKTIPLIALYKQHCTKKCFELLSKGERRLRKLVSKLNTKTILVRDEDIPLVKNMNTIEDLNTSTNAVNH